MQYLQKNLGNEIDFLPVDKHESFLQVDGIMLDVVARHTQSTKSKKFAISLQYLKENVKDEVAFCMQINIQGFFKLILS